MRFWQAVDDRMDPKILSILSETQKSRRGRPRRDFLCCCAARKKSGVHHPQLATNQEGKQRRLGYNFDIKTISQIAPTSRHS